MNVNLLGRVKQDPLDHLDHRVFQVQEHRERKVPPAFQVHREQQDFQVNSSRFTIVARTLSVGRVCIGTSLSDCRNIRILYAQNAHGLGLQNAEKKISQNRIFNKSYQVVL